MKKSELETARSEINVKDRAFRDLQRISREWLGIILLADELGEMASIDEAIQASKKIAQEAEARLSTLTGEVSAAQAERDRARTEHTQDTERYRSAFDTAEQRLVDINNEIAEVVPAAQREAARLMESAEVIVRAARTEADKARREAIEQGRAEGKALVDKAVALASEKHAELQHLLASCEHAQTRLDEIRAAIARIAAQ